MKISREARKFLEDVLTPLPWWEDALCAQVDPDLFYPEKGGSNTAARKVCSRCPVRTLCLQEALSGDWGDFGLWAGTSPQERRKMGRAA